MLVVVALVADQAVVVVLDEVVSAVVVSETVVDDVVEEAVVEVVPPAPTDRLTVPSKNHFDASLLCGLSIFNVSELPDAADKTLSFDPFACNFKSLTVGSSVNATTNNM